MQSSRPSALIVLDGAADRPEPSLGGATPLLLAQTPNLDRIARRARGGMIQVLPNGGAPQTHSGMLSLLGYPEIALRAKRGCLEASVIFGGMRPGSLYARGNLSSLVGGRVPSRRVNRDVSQSEADEICTLLTESVPALTRIQCRFKSYSTYRLAIELELGAAATDAISGTDPGYASDEFGAATIQEDFEPVSSRPLDASPEARSSSEAVNAVTRACNFILDGNALNTRRAVAGRLPINHVLMRDFGVSLPDAPPFEERWGVRAKYFHDLPVELGVATFLNMDHEEAGCASVTAAAFDDAGRRLVRDLASYDFICFHVKGPDEPGHDRDWKGKVRAIETVDSGLFSLLAEQVEASNVTVAVTSDHATCWAVGTHTADKVPLIIADEVTHDPRLRLTEVHCPQQTCDVDAAWMLMGKLLGDLKP